MIEPPVDEIDETGLEAVAVEVTSRATDPALLAPYEMLVTRRDGEVLLIGAMTIADVALFVLSCSPSRGVSCRGTHEEVETLRLLTEYHEHGEALH